MRIDKKKFILDTLLLLLLVIVSHYAKHTGFELFGLHFIGAAGLTFGYTTKGTGLSALMANQLIGSVFTSPSDISGATINKITRAGIYFPDPINLKGVIVLHSDLTVIANGVGGEVTVSSGDFGNPGWDDSIFGSSPSLSNSTDYVLSCIINNDYYYTANDAGSANQRHLDESNNYSSPQDLGSVTHGDVKESIYITYTAGGGGNPVQPNHLMSLMGCGN